MIDSKEIYNVFCLSEGFEDRTWKRSSWSERGSIICKAHGEKVTQEEARGSEYRIICFSTVSYFNEVVSFISKIK